MLASGGVDVRLPGGALNALFLAPVVVGVLAGFEHSFFGTLEDAAAGSAITFSPLDPFFVTSFSGDSVFRSSHSLIIRE